MKVLLVNPPTYKLEAFPVIFNSISTELLSLGYIASVLMRSGHEVIVLDIFRNSNLKRFESDLKRINPDIVGLTSTATNQNYANEIADIVKRVDNKIVTIIGGPQASAVPNEVIKSKSIDICVVGEGEETVVELLNNIENNMSLKKVKGIVFKESSDIIETKPRPLIKELDKIPYPLRFVNGENISSDIRIKRRVWGIMSSRGCPFDCSFCDQSVFGRVWRAHSPERVVNEIKHLKSKYGANFISFEDDNFLASRKRVFEICEMMINDNLNIEWSCSARVNDIEPEILGLMKKSGCSVIYPGLESGSDEVLELLNKRTDTRCIREKVNLMKNHGMVVYGNFLIGTPYDTKKTIDKTINFSLELPLDGVSYNIFVPYSNIPIRNLCENKGDMEYDSEKYRRQTLRPPYIPEGLSKSYLLRKQLSAYIKFYSRRGRIFNIISSFIRNYI